MHHGEDGDRRQEQDEQQGQDPLRDVGDHCEPSNKVRSCRSQKLLPGVVTHTSGIPSNWPYAKETSDCSVNHAMAPVGVGDSGWVTGPWSTQAGRTNITLAANGLALLTTRFRERG